MKEFQAADGTIDSAFMALLKARDQSELMGAVSLFIDGREHVPELDSAEILIRLKPKRPGRGWTTRNVVLTLRDRDLLFQLLQLMEDESDDPIQEA